MSQLAHPLLKESSVGSIVLLSSLAGLLSLGRASVYGATKGNKYTYDHQWCNFIFNFDRLCEGIVMFYVGAINQLTRSLACEWARDNIRANCVAPGATRTALSGGVSCYKLI